MIPAGGMGMRFGAKKQFVNLAGRPLILRTVEGIIKIFEEKKRFQDIDRAGFQTEHTIELKKIIVAVPCEDVMSVSDMFAPFSPLVAIVPGGGTRAESVKSAYQCLTSFYADEWKNVDEWNCTDDLKDADDSEHSASHCGFGEKNPTRGDSESENDAVSSVYIAVHDGCRPFASEGLWCALLRSLCSGADFVLPYTLITDTLKSKTNMTNIPRENCIAVQTPQVMRLPVADRIYHLNVTVPAAACPTASSVTASAAYTVDTSDVTPAAVATFDASITDDATLAEKCGFSITPVKGEKMNIKITDPEDFLIAESLLSSSHSIFISP